MTTELSPSLTVPTWPVTRVPAVRAAEMAQVDRLAIEQFGISLLQMMEQAGSHLAEVVRMELDGSLVGRRIVVVAGSGNNGAGGLAAARHLANRGASVRVALARPALRLTAAGRHQLATLLAMHVTTCVAGYDFETGELEHLLEEADMIVDALLGYNAVGAPYGEIAAVMRQVLAAGRPVVSLDIPSGLDPDTGGAAAEAVLAQATLTLALPKAGLLSGAGQVATGRLYLGDLGLPVALYHSLGLEVQALFQHGPIVRLDVAA